MTYASIVSSAQAAGVLTATAVALGASSLIIPVSARLGPTASSRPSR